MGIYRKEKKYVERDPWHLFTLYLKMENPEKRRNACPIWKGMA
jgi:hypothetical protein